MTRSKFVVWLMLVVAIPSASTAQDIENRVVEHTLSNGMKFLLLERHQSPVFSGYLMFRVGSVDERPGITGLAHLFEHMAFKGTKVIGTQDYAKEKPLLDKLDELAQAIDTEQKKGARADSTRLRDLMTQFSQTQEAAGQLVTKDELNEIYSKNGANNLNAGTGTDMTLYYVSLPSNRLELWALMESERLLNPVMREFYAERDVVAEERRRRTDTQPGGKLYEQFIATAFQAHPYQWPTVGWMSDITRVTRTEAEAFYRTYYAPNNAVAAIVGDIKTQEIIPLLEKYFGRIPRGPDPPSVRTTEPEQAGERRVTIEFDAESQLMIGYHKPTVPTYDDYVFDVIHGLLSDGRTSRLYTTLVKEKQLVTSVSTSNGEPGGRYDNLFFITATPRHPHTTEEVENAIYAELERLKTEPVTDRELQKVRNQLEANFLRGLNSNAGLAFQLTYFDTIAGDWRYVVRHSQVISKITLDDIKRVATQYFTKTNRTAATLIKKTASAKAMP